MADSCKPPGPMKAEYVVRKKAVEHYGRHVMEALSRMVLPKDIFTRNKKEGEN